MEESFELSSVEGNLNLITNKTESSSPIVIVVFSYNGDSKLNHSYIKSRFGSIWTGEILVLGAENKESLASLLRRQWDQYMDLRDCKYVVIDYGVVDKPDFLEINSIFGKATYGNITLETGKYQFIGLKSIK